MQCYYFNTTQETNSDSIVARFFADHRWSETNGLMPLPIPLGHYKKLALRNLWQWPDAAVRVCDLCYHASGHSEEFPSFSGGLAAQEVRAAPVASITVNLVLEITLQSARGLKNMDTFSLSDPFVDISMQPFGRRSRVIDDNLNPEWTEKFILPWEGSSSSSSSSSKILTFEVFDRDVVFNGTSSLNHIMICLSKYICHTTTARTYRECQAVCE
jgi:hypothetical protein